MKNIRFVFVMAVWAALMAAVINNSSYGQTFARMSNRTPTLGKGDRFHDNSQTPHKAVSAHSQVKQVPAHRLHSQVHSQTLSQKRQAKNNPAAKASGTVADSRRVDPHKYSGPPNKMVDRRTPPVRLPTVAALSGQQFKDDRNRSSRLAIEGAPNATSSTAALGGNAIRRKP